MSIATPSSPETRGLSLPAGDVILTGDLILPPVPHGLVIFAHGSGSSRLSPRNRRVAEGLQAGGFGTLMFDLLTPGEESLDAVRGHLRFDIPLLARRLSATTEWIARQPGLTQLPIGCFGASTGAAAALVAAGEGPDLIRAVVSRGGRPDLAGASLGRVRAPTLLIVGGNDRAVMAMNQEALGALTGAEKNLVVIRGASHLFEEPGAMEQVTDLARAWFARYLAASPSSDRDKDAGPERRAP